VAGVRSVLAGISLALFVLMWLPMMRRCTAIPPNPRASSGSGKEKLRAIPSTENLRAYMQRLSARPHHVGSPYDKDNAEWIAAKFKEFGLETHIESYDVLFPTPKERQVELLDCSGASGTDCRTKFTAKLEEPSLPEDPTSNQNPSNCQPSTRFPGMETSPRLSST